MNNSNRLEISWHPYNLMIDPPSIPVELVLPLFLAVRADGDDAGGRAWGVCYHNHLFLLSARLSGFQVVRPLL